MDLALNNLQRLICHKTQTNNQPINQLKTFGKLSVLHYLQSVRNTSNILNFHLCGENEIRQVVMVALFS